MARSLQGKDQTKSEVHKLEEFRHILCQLQPQKQDVIHHHDRLRKTTVNCVWEIPASECLCEISNKKRPL